MTNVLGSTSLASTTRQQQQRAGDTRTRAELLNIQKMTFKVHRKHFENLRTTPISLKTYILTKHLWSYSRCNNYVPMKDPKEDEPCIHDSQEGKDSDNDLPVAIANMSARPVYNQDGASTSQAEPPRRRRSIHCTQCEKTFTHRGDFNKHLRTHSGEKPYPCPHANCDKSFAHSSNLRRHIVVHSGDKPFDCDKCGRKFNRKDKLLLHQQTKLCRKRSQISSTSTATTTT